MRARVCARACVCVCVSACVCMCVAVCVCVRVSEGGGARGAGGKVSLGWRVTLQVQRTINQPTDTSCTPCPHAIRVTSNSVLTTLLQIGRLKVGGASKRKRYCKSCVVVFKHCTRGFVARQSRTLCF